MRACILRSAMSAPESGARLYAADGELKYQASTGLITVIATANPERRAEAIQFRCPGYNMLPDHGCGQRLIPGNMLCDDCREVKNHDEYKEEFAKRREQKDA